MGLIRASPRRGGALPCRRAFRAGLRGEAGTCSRFFVGALAIPGAEGPRTIPAGRKVRSAAAFPDRYRCCPEGESLRVIPRSSGELRRSAESPCPPAVAAERASGGAQRAAVAWWGRGRG